MRTKATVALQALVVLAILSVAACPAERGNPPPQDSSSGIACVDTCASLGHACGEVCGQPCGTCAPDAQGHPLTCLAGQCRCVPVCRQDACGVEDGCGGTCPCPADTSCPDCLLRLVRLDQHDVGSGVQRVTLALEGMNVSGPSPSLADLAVATDPPMKLEQVDLGPALVDSRKLLHRFVGSNLPFRSRPDGSWRILVETGAHHVDIPAGRWLTLHFVSPSETPPAGPVSFRLVRQAEVVGPRDANQALQASTYDAPLVVSPVR